MAYTYICFFIFFLQCWIFMAVFILFHSIVINCCSIHINNQMASIFLRYKIIVATQSYQHSLIVYSLCPFLQLPNERRAIHFIQWKYINYYDLKHPRFINPHSIGFFFPWNFRINLFEHHFIKQNASKYVLLNVINLQKKLSSIVEQCNQFHLLLE